MANEEKPNFTPYEKTHDLKRLLFVVTIVGQGQSKAIIDLNLENEVALCLSVAGLGTAPRPLYAVFGVGELKKDVVFSVMREEKWRVYREQISARFSVSSLAKGLCFCIPIDSIAGVSIYKMLSNTRQFERPIETKHHKKDRKGEKR